MTFAVFIVLILGVFIGLLNILPSVSAFPIDGTNTFGTIISFMKAWDFFLPIHELLILVTITFTFEISVWFWHISMRVVRFLRGHADGA